VKRGIIAKEQERTMATIERPSEDGEIVDGQTVRFKRLLPGPLERVWAYLTEPEKRAQWFAGGEMELRAGGKAELFFRHANLMEPGETAPEKFKQAVDGLTFETRITRCEPPRVLAFLFGEDEDGSEVVIELEPQGDQVLLTLTNRRLPSREEMVDVSGGWHLHLTMLRHVLEGTPPPRFWDTQAKLAAKYAHLIP
jgi:uncharacterized protein YndB with AHSA1/START domain